MNVGLNCIYFYSYKVVSIDLYQKHLVGKLATQPLRLSHVSTYNKFTDPYTRKI